MATEQKTQMTTQSAISATNIGSKHYITQLESVIIQIARSLAVEHQLPVDPDAKEMTRNIIQSRINNLLAEPTLEEIKKLNKNVTEQIKTAKDSQTKELAIKLYHLLKLVSLDDV